MLTSDLHQRARDVYARASRFPSKADATRTRFRYTRKRPLIFRWPAPPYLLATDVLAFVAARFVVGGPQVLPDALALLVLIAAFHARGLYRSRLSISVLDDSPFLVGGVVAAALVAGWFDAATSVVGMSLNEHVGRGLVLLTFVLVARNLGYGTMRAARRTGYVRHSTLIIGAGHLGLRLAETLQRHRAYGLDPIGFIDTNPRLEEGAEPPAPVLGSYQALITLITDFDVRVVIVAFGTLREAQLVELLRACDRMHCDILFVPRFYELHPVTREMDQIRGIPLVRVRRAPFRSVSWRLKRILDSNLAAVALIALFPVLVACAVAVRWESGPGFLFRQKRVGLDGHQFTLLKFRSMRPATESESTQTWNIAFDDRIGPVGKFLRRTSLDELPQLWNVLVGDMSLIGPRPERQHFVDEFATSIPRYTARHRVPAGLSGWAQVHGLRGDTSIEDRAYFDNHYIENWSLWGDFKIMIRTMEQVFRRSGS